MQIERHYFIYIGRKYLPTGQKLALLALLAYRTLDGGSNLAGQARDTCCKVKVSPQGGGFCSAEVH